MTLSRNKKVLIGIAVFVLLVAVAGVGYAQTGGSSSAKNKDLVILSDVQRRTLQDTVTLTGTLARQELRKVTAATQSLVSSVYAKDGSTGHDGEALFALDGRDAIAENGTVRFFRSLTVGDRGDDVLQLKQILAAAGDNPGAMDTLFTEQTRFALAQWQAQHHYPGATPTSSQAVTVSLAQGAGYKLGAQTAAGLIIGPAATQTSATTVHSRPTAVLAAFRPNVAAVSSPSSVLTIQSVSAVVPQGTPASFVITASAPTTGDLTVNLTSGGTATSNDVVTPPTSVVLPSGLTSVSVSVPTRLDNVVKPSKTLVVSLAAGAGYSVGSPGSAQTTITNNNVPAIHISGGSTVAPGGSATLVVTADQAPIRDTQVSLTFSGDAVPGTDYRTVNPILTLSAGHTSASIQVSSLANNVIQPDRHIVVSIGPAPTSYSIASPGSAVITITGATGNAATPVATLRSATAYLTKGQPWPVTISINKALTSTLTVSLTYGGNAQEGVDYTLPGGVIVVPAGQTSVQVAIPTVLDNVVEADRLLTVSLAPSSAYQIGSPSAAAVAITSSVVPELTIAGNVAAVAPGGAATFTITANQAPVKDTSVNYTVAGSAQPGQDFQPLVGTALLPAGQTQVTVVLRSIEKDVVFQPTDMVVGEWPIRIGQVFVKEGDGLMPGAPILSLTEPNFTVTLQASATDRTKLKVGQHCTVQLVGGTDEVDGTISELDANQTQLDSTTPGQPGQQVYEGKIEVADLGAADGAAVTVKVIDQQDTNVITVPIAAVKQNGSGVDVVRVIDLSNSGKIREIPVQTGLSEGSYIEITKGLKGDETVVVEVDQPQ